MQKIECPFCDKKIINSQRILESESFYLLINTNPLCPGHSLIVSKDHILRESEISNWKDYNRILLASYKYVIKRYGIEPINYINSPQSFSVPHFHRHLVPYPFVPHDIDQALRKVVERGKR